MRLWHTSQLEARDGDQHFEVVDGEKRETPLDEHRVISRVSADGVHRWGEGETLTIDGSKLLKSFTPEFDAARGIYLAGYETRHNSLACLAESTQLGREHAMSMCRGGMPPASPTGNGLDSPPRSPNNHLTTQYVVALARCTGVDGVHFKQLHSEVAPAKLKSHQLEKSCGRGRASYVSVPRARTMSTACALYAKHLR